MPKLHPKLRHSLGMLPVDKPVSLLTRHSIREKADQAVVSYRAPLTKEGIELARQWGSEFKKPIVDIYSSPVGRCVETAKALLDGAKPAIRTDSNLVMPPNQIDVKTSLILVEPGCFVQDINIAGPEFLRAGPVDFFNRHINQSIEGVLSPNEGSKNLLNYLQNNQSHPGSLVVHVTHDTILAAFIYYLLGAKTIDDDLWPWMMEGTFLWFDDDHVHFIWRGHCHSREWASIF